jgi:hypothetical protein
MKIKPVKYACIVDWFGNDQIFDKERRRIMTIIEVILAGESKNVEFKENLPEK